MIVKYYTRRPGEKKNKENIYTEIQYIHRKLLSAQSPNVHSMLVSSLVLKHTSNMNREKTVRNPKRYHMSSMNFSLFLSCIASDISFLIYNSIYS